MCDKKKCKRMKSDGRQCGAYAQAGSEYCFQHDPAKESTRTEARQKGGRARASQISGAIVPTLTTATGVRDYIERAIRDTAAGLMDARRARAIVGLCRIQLEAIKRANLEGGGGLLDGLNIY